MHNTTLLKSVTLQLSKNSQRQVNNKNCGFCTCGKEEDVIIHIINKLGRQLTSLMLYGPGLIDAVYFYLNNCELMRLAAHVLHPEMRILETSRTFSRDLHPLRVSRTPIRRLVM